MMSQLLFQDENYTSPNLAHVVTLREVCFLWGKSPRQVYYGIDRGHLHARKSVTGGSWLLDYQSVISHWGEPETPITEWKIA